MKKWLRWTLGISLGLAAIVTALWWEENWRGQRMWEESCARLRAAGEPVELADIVPPLIPDEDNAAMAPIFVEVFEASDPYETRLGKLPRYFGYEPDDDTFPRVHEPMPRRPMTKEDTSYLALWQAHLAGYFSKTPTMAISQPSPDEVLRSLSDWDDEWHEAVAAMQRPKCRWPLNYDDSRRVKLTNFDAIRGLLCISHPRLMALAVKGDGEEYAKTLITSLRLARSCIDPPVDLLSYTMGSGATGMTLKDWLYTLACVDLNESQLHALQNEAQLVSVAGVMGMIRSDRVRISHLFQTMSADEFAALDLFGGSADDFQNQAKGIALSIRPRGWRLLEAAMYQDFVQEHVLSCVSERANIVDPRSVARIETAAADLLVDAGPTSLLRQVPAVLNCHDFMLKYTAANRARASAAVVWCALERFRLRKGHIPDALEDLVPEFIKKLPCDPVNGEPLRYLRKGERDYLLYAIGWNLKDDGGLEMNKGDDWVWASNPKLIENPSLEKLLAEERERAEKVSDRRIKSK